MEIFVNLIHRKAPLKTFQKELGLTKEQILNHTGNIRFYERVTEYSKQIRELFKDKEKNMDEIKRLRKELNQYIEDWKDDKV